MWGFGAETGLNSQRPFPGENYPNRSYLRAILGRGLSCGQNEDLIGLKEIQDEDDEGTIASEEGARASPDRGSPGHSFFAIDRPRPPIVLDPSVEFLLKSSGAHPVGCS